MKKMFRFLVLLVLLVGYGSPFITTPGRRSFPGTRQPALFSRRNTLSHEEDDSKWSARQVAERRRFNTLIYQAGARGRWAEAQSLLATFLEAAGASAADSFSSGTISDDLNDGGNLGVGDQRAVESPAAAAAAAAAAAPPNSYTLNAMLVAALSTGGASSTSIDRNENNGDGKTALTSGNPGGSGSAVVETDTQSKRVAWVWTQLVEVGERSSPQPFRCRPDTVSLNTLLKQWFLPNTNTVNDNPPPRQPSPPPRADAAGPSSPPSSPPLLPPPPPPAVGDLASAEELAAELALRFGVVPDATTVNSLIRVACSSTHTEQTSQLKRAEAYVALLERAVEGVDGENGEKAGDEEDEDGEESTNTDFALLRADGKRRGRRSQWQKEVMASLKHSLKQSPLRSGSSGGRSDHNHNLVAYTSLLIGHAKEFDTRDRAQEGLLSREKGGGDGDGGGGGLRAAIDIFSRRMPSNGVSPSVVTITAVAHALVDFADRHHGRQHSNSGGSSGGSDSESGRVSIADIAAADACRLLCTTAAAATAAASAGATGGGGGSGATGGGASGATGGGGGEVSTEAPSSLEFFFSPLLLSALNLKQANQTEEERQSASPPSPISQNGEVGQSKGGVDLWKVFHQSGATTTNTKQLDRPFFNVCLRALRTCGDVSGVIELLDAMKAAPTPAAAPPAAAAAAPTAAVPPAEQKEKLRAVGGGGYQVWRDAEKAQQEKQQKKTGKKGETNAQRRTRWVAMPESEKQGVVAAITRKRQFQQKLQLQLDNKRQLQPKKRDHQKVTQVGEADSKAAETSSATSTVTTPTNASTHAQGLKQSLVEAAKQAAAARTRGGLGLVDEVSVLTAVLACADVGRLDRAAAILDTFLYYPNAGNKNGNGNDKHQSSNLLPAATARCFNPLIHALTRGFKRFGVQPSPSTSDLESAHQWRFEAAKGVGSAALSAPMGGAWALCEEMVCVRKVAPDACTVQILMEGHLRAEEPKRALLAWHLLLRHRHHQLEDSSNNGNDDAELDLPLPTTAACNTRLKALAMSLSNVGLTTAAAAGDERGEQGGTDDAAASDVAVDGSNRKRNSSSSSSSSSSDSSSSSGSSSGDSSSSGSSCGSSVAAVGDDAGCRKEATAVARGRSRKGVMMVTKAVGKETASQVDVLKTTLQCLESMVATSSSPSSMAAAPDTQTLNAALAVCAALASPTATTKAKIIPYSSASAAYLSLVATEKVLSLLEGRKEGGGDGGGNDDDDDEKEEDDNSFRSTSSPPSPSRDLATYHLLIKGEMLRGNRRRQEGEPAAPVGTLSSSSVSGSTFLERSFLLASQAGGGSGGGGGALFFSLSDRTYATLVTACLASHATPTAANPTPPPSWPSPSASSSPSSSKLKQPRQQLYEQPVVRNGLDESLALLVHGGFAKFASPPTSNSVRSLAETHLPPRRLPPPAPPASTLFRPLYHPTLLRLLRALVSSHQSLGSGFRLGQAVGLLTCQLPTPPLLPSASSSSSSSSSSPHLSSSPTTTTTEFSSRIPADGNKSDDEELPLVDTESASTAAAAVEAAAAVDCYVVVADACVRFGQPKLLEQVMAAAAKTGVSLGNRMSLSSDLQDGLGTELWAGRAAASTFVGATSALKKRVTSTMREQIGKRISASIASGLLRKGASASATPQSFDTEEVVWAANEEEDGYEEEEEEGEEEWWHA